MSKPWDHDKVVSNLDTPDVLDAFIKAKVTHDHAYGHVCNGYKEGTAEHLIYARTITRLVGGAE